METYCTRPDCSQPINQFRDLDNLSHLTTTQQKYCHTCGMPQILGGRYIPQKLLGKGGFGAAYLGCDRYSPKFRHCVIKQFQPASHLTGKKLKMAKDLFSREAEALELLGNQHSQIPNLYGFFPLIHVEENGEQNQFFYLVQEYIDGESLFDEVNRKGKFSETEIYEILTNLLPVLQFIHDHHSIHRDIKPSNIMRDREGKLYLLDFGAVKQVTGATDPPYSTGIYSVGYAPPEQMQGGRVYPSSDLYALAATCIRLLTAKPISELYDSYSNEWLWHEEVEISDQLKAVLDEMLLKTPKDRIQSAQAVLSILQDESNLEAETKTTISQQPDYFVPTPYQQSPVPTSKQQLKTRSFSWLEWLLHAAFTGLEGTLLLLIALRSESAPPAAISMGIWGMMMGGFIYAQWKRWIGKWDVVIIGGVTLILVVVVVPISIERTIAAVVMGTSGAIALVSLAKLIDQRFWQTR